MGAYARRLCTWLIAITVSASALSVEATEPAPTDLSAAPYTLSQAFDDALARDARIQAAKSRIGQARQGLEEVNSEKRPKISLTGNSGYAYNRSEARSVSTYDGLALKGGINVQQNVVQLWASGCARATR